MRDMLRVVSQGAAVGRRGVVAERWTAGADRPPGDTRSLAQHRGPGIGRSSLRLDDHSRAGALDDATPKVAPRTWCSPGGLLAPQSRARLARQGRGGLPVRA